jgi:hypothetical protein
MEATLNTNMGVGTPLSAATLPAVPLGQAAIGQAVGVSLELAGFVSVLALYIWGLRKSFELSFGTK